MTVWENGRGPRDHPLEDGVWGVSRSGGVARPLRIEQGGLWYHITSRGNGCARMFRDDRHRGRFVELRGEPIGRFRWRVCRYALMDNHYHLEVETVEVNLSRGMQ